MKLKTQVHYSNQGDIMVTITIPKLEMYANDRASKLLDYILLQAGDTLAKELVEKHRDEVLQLITPDKILEIISQKVKESIKIGDPIPDKK